MCLKAGEHITSFGFIFYGALNLLNTALIVVLHLEHMKNIRQRTRTYLGLGISKGGVRNVFGN